MAATTAQRVKSPSIWAIPCARLLSYLGRHKLSAAGGGGAGDHQRPGQSAGHVYDPPGGQHPGGRRIGRPWSGVWLLTAGDLCGGGAVLPLATPRPWCKAAQQVLYDIRRDLFAHLQTLPLRFFDTRRHGDIMSYFTNDVDTIADALNNSFAMVIQSFIQMVGTLVHAVHPQLAAFPGGGGVLCWPCSSTSASAASRSKAYYTQASRPAWEIWTATSRR